MVESAEPSQDVLELLTQVVFTQFMVAYHENDTQAAYFLCLQGAVHSVLKLEPENQTMLQFRRLLPAKLKQGIAIQRWRLAVTRKAVRRVKRKVRRVRKAVKKVVKKVKKKVKRKVQAAKKQANTPHRKRAKSLPGARRQVARRRQSRLRTPLRQRQQTPASPQCAPHTPVSAARGTGDLDSSLSPTLCEALYMASLNSNLLVPSHAQRSEDCGVPSRLLFSIKHRQATRTTFTRRPQISKKSPEIRVKNESPFALLQHRKDFQFIQDDLFLKYLRELRRRSDRKKLHSPPSERVRVDRLKVSVQRTRAEGQRRTPVRAEEQVSLLLAKISGRSGSAGLPSSSESPSYQGGRRVRKASSSAEPVRSLSRDMSGASLRGESPRLVEAREGICAKIQQSIATAGVVPPTTCDFYLFGHMLGKGAFGKVYLGVHKLTGCQVAIKSIEKTYLKDERVKRKVYQEVAGMSRIRHPNVVRLYEVFESVKHFHLVMEYCGGGTLLQFVKSRTRLEADTARTVFRQLLKAVKACHGSGIAHRDLKLENIFFDSGKQRVKVGDFGMSRAVKAGQRVQEQCGTLAYTAPEVLVDREYEPFPVDVWGLGVVLFSMLTGKNPFQATSSQELLRTVLRGEVAVPEYVESCAQELIRSLLTVSPAARLTLSEAETHPWVTGTEGERGCHIESTQSNDSLDAVVLERMALLGFPCDYVTEALRNKELNHATATYHILRSCASN